MRKHMNRYFFMLLIMLILSASSNAFASSILAIVPAALTLGVSKTGTASMQYSVTNNTKHPVNQLIIDPAYQSNGHAAGISVAANACFNETLLPNASCTFDVLINGSGQPHQFNVRPRVCAYNGTVCSVPLAVDTLQVTVSPVPTVVSVTPSGDVAAANVNSVVLTFSQAMDATTLSNNTVSLTQSGVNTNLIGTCVPSSDKMVFTCSVNSTLVGSQLYIVTVSTAVRSTDGVPLASNSTTNFTTSSRFAYVANYNGQFVSICPITDPSTGALSNTCTSFASAGSSGVTVNPAGTILYITNANNCPNSTVTSCTINNTDGSLSGCSTTADASFCYPTAVAIHGNIAYVNNYGNNTVSNCTIQSNGSLTGCSVSTLPTIVGHNYGYDGVALNSSGTLLYVTQAQSSSGQPTAQNILACPVQNGAVVGASCVSYVEPSFNVTAGIALNSLNSILYVANSGNNVVSACILNADGSINTCNALTSSIFNTQQFGKTVLNAASTYIYVVNQNLNYVSLCQLNPDGTFTGSNYCSKQLATLGLSGPQGIALL
jgi:6-phosphogluconolactonase (cycloisomerase 2 family)